MPTIAPSPVPIIDVYPRYIVPADGSVDRETANWLQFQNGEGPLRIEDVTDVCATYHVTATLHDDHGKQIGRVFATGAYEIE